MSVQVQNGPSGLETRYEYLSYDARGHLTAGRKSNDQTTSVIYGYDGNYPVAFIKNGSTTGDFAYTDFEDKASLLMRGGWTVSSGTTVLDGTSPMGGKCYTLSAGQSIQKTGLSSGKHYILTYWSKNGVYSVTGSISVITKQALSGWTLYQHDVTGVSSTSIQGSGRIDMVKLFANDAQITTFSYEPLIGITSTTDTNNISNYFEYDASGRLQIIRDNNHNVVKTMSYNYFKPGE